MNSILEAKPADVDAVLPLFLAYLAFYERSVRPEDARAFLTERLAREESVIYVATRGGEAVGFVQLYPTFSSLGLKRSWILNDLFVKPEARRFGIAAALMERARELATASGAEEMSLETARDNVSAQRLYEKLGWQRDDEFLRYHLTRFG